MIRTILICFIINSSCSLTAQSLLIGGGPTVSSYFGDLSSNILKQSLSQIHPGINLYAAKSLWNKVYLEIDFDQSTVSGDDKISGDAGRVSRNLNFKSTITGVSGLLGFRLAALHDDKAGLTGAFGLNVFKFDPQAFLDGYYVRLQPLGTEGQGISGSGKNKYSLIQSSKMFQIGAYLRMKESVFLEIEFTQYFTSTDYLDDVSSTYFDAEQIRKIHGNIAWKLADRHAEIDPGSPKYPSGQARGNPKKNDQYSYLKVGLSVGLNSNNLHYSTLRSKTKNSKIRCPKVKSFL